MNNWLEALQQNIETGTAEPGLKSGSDKKQSYQVTLGQLADVYFAGTGKKRESPIVIQVVEKRRSLPWVSWLAASFALLLAAFSLFSTKRILVHVQVVDAAAPEAASKPHRQGRGGEGRGEEGRRLPLEGLVFEGASKLKSSKEGGTAALINSSVAPFAQANLYFEPPLDLSAKKIVFYAKGGKGGENLAVALKDQNNVQAFERGRLFPFPDRLTSGWRKAEIFVEETAALFDKRRVTHLRFEFGSKNAQNKPGDAIFIKDLRIVAA
ncbi:MAG: hypothetical protein HY593_04455 [Candidatus Omnitrophica bacterium]|nr:hypothetical protein [Candidatus Omnitrophota bacterium]